MNKSIKRILVLCRRNILEILRDPLSLILMLALPLTMEIIFYFLFHKLTSQFEMRYLAPSIAVFAGSFLTLFTGLLISMDRGTSFLTRLYVNGARSYEFIAGYALALIPVSFVQTLIFFIAGGIIDSSVFSWHMIPALLFTFLSSVMFIGFGILFGSVCNEKSVGGVSSIIITLQSVLSGMWFPEEGLGGGMVTVMKCLPFKNATDLIKNALNGTDKPVDDIVVPLLIVLAYTLVVYIAAILVFKKKMKAD